MANTTSTACGNRHATIQAPPAMKTVLFRKKALAQVLAQAAGGEGEEERSELSRQLGARDLMSLGIAAIVGAGIFSTIGMASAEGGPGVVLLFLFTAIACSCTAFAYAEFASMVPVAGSAYTYSYVAFGEIIAWIIGWALILEYAIGNVTVAVSWSDYFTSLLAAANVHVPGWASTDYVSASRAFSEATAAMTNGQSLDTLTPAMRSGYRAWSDAPSIGGFHVILDLPAVLITCLVTYIVYIGVRESRNLNNAMVIVKLAVIAAVIIVGAFFVKPANWDPFLPNGVPGLLKGVSAVFFAYIGFDAISTMAEECRNPERDMPRGIMGAILISTVLYVLIGLVLTGMVPFSQLGVGDPLAYVFSSIGMPWFAGIVAVSAVVAMTSVLLVFQLGQPRIWMAMSRDGLLPEVFARVHPRYRTPSYATIVTAVVVIVPTLLIPGEAVIQFCSMGTLAAFVLVCAGVLKLQDDPNRPSGKFRTPYINGKYILPISLVLTVILVRLYAHEWWTLTDFQSFERDKDKIPMYLFVLLSAWLAVQAYRRNLSLIPSLGLLFSFFMMAQLPFVSWLAFAGWLGVGLLIYFSFGVTHSKLAQVRPKRRKGDP
jgi:basic amino acid/polyamine antiporter, APA family